MRRLVLLFIFLLLSGTGLEAQSVSKIVGVVRDSSTRKPIGDAGVIVKGIQTGSYTDSRGQFEIDNLYEGRYTLQVTHIGYHSESRNISVPKEGAVRVTFRLQQKSYTGAPVVVEGIAGRSNTIILGRSEINESDAQTVGELLKQIPEVLVTTNPGSGGTAVRIRGSDTDQVLVTLNGIPINDPMTGETNLDLIPLDFIRKITVRTRGSSAEYGSGAFGGVIAIETGITRMEQATLGLRYGNYVQQISPSFSGNIAGLALSLSLLNRRENNDFPYTYARPAGQIVHRQRLNADVQLRSMQSSLQYEFGNHMVRVQGYAIDSDRGMPGKVYYWTPYARARDFRYGIDGAYRWSTATDQLNLRTSYKNSHAEYQNDPPANAPVKYRKIPAYSSAYHHSTILNNLDYAKTFNEHFQWQTSFQFRNTGFSQTNVLTRFGDPIQSVQQNFGLATGADLQITIPHSPFFLTSSPRIRYSRIAVTGNGTSLQFPFFSHSEDIGLHWNGRISGTVYGSHNRSFRIPTFADLFYQDFRVSGNPDLRPERSRESSLGLRIYRDKNWRSSLQLEGFRKSVRDEIFWTQSWHGSFVPHNTDSYITGESIQVDFTGPANIVSGSTYLEHLNPVNKSQVHPTHNKILPFRPVYRGQFQLRLKLSPVTLRYIHRAVGPRFITKANTKTVPSYQVGEVMIMADSYQPEFLPAQWSFTLSLQVQNVWNTEYQVVNRMPEPGRTFRFSLETAYKPKTASRRD